MITKYSYKKMTWIDVENPTLNEVKILKEEYDLPNEWMRDLALPSERAKIDVQHGMFYAVLHYPDHPADNHDFADIEIDYVVGEQFIITAHYTQIDTFLHIIEATKGKPPFATGAEMFLELNNQLYRGLREELEPIRHAIKKTESAVFSGNELHMVKELSHLHRKLLNFKQSLRSHRTILKSFELQMPLLFPKIAVDSDRVFREYFRVENALENNYELLRELRATNDSLLTSKNNDITKRFTMMAFFTFPLALLVAILALENSPAFLHTQNGFWTIVCIVIIIFLAMYLYFKYKKWM